MEFGRTEITGTPLATVECTVYPPPNTDWVAVGAPFCPTATSTAS